MSARRMKVTNDFFQHIVTTLNEFSLIANARNEPAMHVELDSFLAMRGFNFTHEFTASSGRFDFFVEGVVIEIKSAGGVQDIIRQLHRYANDPVVAGIILLTTRNVHRRLPREINGKKIMIMILPERF